MEELNKEIVFVTHNKGKLAEEKIGQDTNKKWSDLWYIYKPNGYEKTLAQMTEEEREGREKIDSVDSMQEFINWYQKNEKE